MGYIVYFLKNDKEKFVSCNFKKTANNIKSTLMKQAKETNIKIEFIGIYKKID